ncbi:uncharacterized protein ACNS7B_005590 isoform 2-T2 [Menidia menidia]
MKGFFLFMFSVISVCEVCKTQPRASRDWVEMKCSVKTNGKYQTAEVSNSNIKKQLKRFTVKIQHKSKTPRCDKTSSQSPGVEEAEFQYRDGCPKPVIQTAYKLAKTTITCKPPEHSELMEIRFFCKEKNSLCDNVLLPTSSQRSDSKVNLTVTSGGFNLSIRNLSLQHDGLYWCGFKEGQKTYRVALTQLVVKKITTFEKSTTSGEDLSFFCKYKDARYSTKFICKGEDPSTCQRLVNTTKPNKNSRFSMYDDKNKKNITVTMRGVTAADSGMYWCGATLSGKQGDIELISRMLLNVEGTGPTPPPAPTTHSRPVLIGGGVFLLLLLLLFLILVVRRFVHLRQKADKVSEQHPKEDYVYEEIEGRTRRPESENTVSGIYALAGFPTVNPLSLHYSTVNFKSSPAPDGQSLAPKTNSTCVYSTLKSSQPPVYATVGSKEKPQQK